MTLEYISPKTTSAPLLATRFFSPPLPARYVSRLRLLERLSMALSMPVILISATAGFGKSLLVSEWMQKQSGLRAAWLSLEEADNDWVRFYRYLVAAWQRIYPQAGESALAELAASPVQNREMLTNSFLNDLLTCQQREGTGHTLLVLDDYHHIESKEIHDTVIYLCEHLPPGCHLALVTRSDPPLPLARWRSHGVLFELRADDLRITSDEASDFLNRVMGLNLPSEQIEILEARTEGWIVGLQMAALALQEYAQRGRGDTQTFVRAFGGSQRYVLDYLLEEVINRQPEEIQQFLLVTSLLKQFCARLCDELLKTTPPYAQRVLERLGKANLFLIPLDDRDTWFRYHHLFADLLQNRLQQTAPERIRAIYSNASEWHAQNEMWREAILYALKLKDYAKIEKLFAQALIAGGIPFLFSGMRFVVSSVPAAVLPGHPCLSLGKAIEMIEYGQITGIEDLLKSAEADLQAQLPFPGQNDILGMIYLIQANTAALIGNRAWIISSAQKAIRLVPLGSQASVEAQVQLGIALYYAGHFNQTVAVWEQALGLAVEQSFTLHILTCLDDLGRFSCHAGELRRAEAYFQRGQSFLRQEGVHSLRWMAAIQRDYADLLRERNQLDVAYEQMIACLPLLEAWELNGGYGLGLLHQGRILTAQGDASGAEEMLIKAEGVCRSQAVYPSTRTLVHLFRVRLILASGDTLSAWQELDTCQNSAYCQHELHREWALAARARILIHMGRPGEALHLIEGRLAQAREAGRGRNWLEMALLSAMAYKAMGEGQKAFGLLAEGLAYAKKEGFIRIFVDEGEAMQALLQQFLAQPAKTGFQGYLADLLMAFPAVTDAGPNNLQKQPGLVEPLTGRELEILGLVCQGLSNAEIAVRLVLSVGTVKTHIHNIFGKLDVRNRPQAIAKASSLGL